MNPFDRLGNPNIGGNFQNSLLQGMELGTQMRERREAKEREAAIDNAYRGVMAGDKTAAQRLGQVPGMAKDAYTLQASLREAEKKQAEDGRSQMAQLAGLLDDSTDEASYQRNLAVAQQLYGPLPASVPRNFDPNWIDTQKRIVSVMMSDPSKLSAHAQKLVEMGLMPNTPAFQKAMSDAVNFELTRSISTEPGGSAGVYGPGAGPGYYKQLVVPNPGDKQAGAPVEAPKFNIPDQAVADLKAGKGSKQQFDEIFGAGAFDYVMGGAASNGGGPFPGWL